MTMNVGQGACQAVEDAGVLARHLLNARDVPSALRAYEAERIPRTTKLVKLARRIADMSRWSNPAAMRVRELVQSRIVARSMMSPLEP